MCRNGGTNSSKFQHISYRGQHQLNDHRHATLVVLSHLRFKYEFGTKHLSKGIISYPM